MSAPESSNPPLARLLRNRRLLGGLAAVAVLAALAALAPHPTAVEIRDWARSLGPLFPLVFFAVHALVCITPFPRTVFTVSAGLIFGPALGVAIATGATTLSAVLALLLVRSLGRRAVASRLTHPAARAVDDRLARRGWLAVGSLRLIAAAPFALVNYCCALSSVRLLPYVVATVVGVLPGTVAVVVLGDALTGAVDPTLLLFSAACFALGLAGLAVDLRHALRNHQAAVVQNDP